MKRKFLKQGKEKYSVYKMSVCICGEWRMYIHIQNDSCVNVCACKVPVGNSYH